MAAEKSIAVIGSINMDLTARADRHPRVGETVMGTDLQYIPGGKGANQAIAAARLGGRVSMFGCVGGDAFGERLTEGLRENGVDVSHIRRIPGESSGIALITVAGGGQQHRSDPRGQQACYARLSCGAAGGNSGIRRRSPAK